MWKTETPASCFECGQAVQTLDDLGGLCIACMQVFCRRHVVIRNGVANCAACERIRLEKEESGPVSQDDADRVSRLLRTDLAGTIGNGHEAVVEEAVARIRLFAHDAVYFEQQVVDEVQQYLHDSFVDTSWPRCPEHPNHPLWYSGGWWQCERSGMRAAPLGGLGARRR